MKDYIEEKLRDAKEQKDLYLKRLEYVVTETDKIQYFSYVKLIDELLDIKIELIKKGMYE